MSGRGGKNKNIFQEIISVEVSVLILECCYDLEIYNLPPEY